MIAAMHNLMQYVRYCRKTGKNFTNGAVTAVFRSRATGFSAMFDRLSRLTMLCNVFTVFCRPHKVINCLPSFSLPAI